MLSAATFRLLQLATRMMFYSAAAPLKWTTPTTSPLPPIIYLTHQDSSIRSKTYKALIGMHFVVLVLYEVFLCTRLGQVLLSQASLSTVLQVVWNLLSYAMPLLIQINNFCKWRDFPQFVNSYIRFFVHFKDKFVLKMYAGRKDLKNGCEGNMKIMLCLGLLISLQNIVLIFKFPNRPYFLTSILTPGSSSWVKKIPLIFLQGWVWLSCWSHIFYYMFNFFAYAHPLVFILKQLRLDAPVVLTSGRLRDSRNFQATYRGLQVLQAMFNMCCRQWLFPTHKAVLVSVATIGIYGAIKIPGPRAIVMGVTATLAMLYLSLMFWRLGKICQKSGETLRSWRQEGRRYFRRFLRSVPPLRVEIGGFYIVDRATVAVIWGTVVNFTTTLLLSF